MYRTFRLRLSFALLSLAIIAGSCQKEAQQVGFGIQPESDRIDILKNDTTSILAFSKRVDSVNTTNTAQSLFGSQSDPVFGVKTASFSAQFRLSRTAFSFGENRVLDSLVLYLRYNSLYGDTLAEQNMKVYQLSDKLLTDTIYYSTTEIGHTETLLADLDFVPNTKDSLAIGQDTVPPLLRVSLTSLNDILGDKLLNATDEQMTSNSSFLDFFFGLRIEAEPVMQGGSIITFDLLDNLSKMTLYYANSEDDSLRFDYIISNNSVRVGHFDHDYSAGDAQFRQQVIEGDTTLGMNTCYTQAMGGVVTKVFFPEIKSWYNDGKITVNDARLYIEGVEDPPLFTPPDIMIVARINEDGSVSPLLEQLEGQQFFGGFYDDENNRYWFRITNYIQDLMEEDAVDRGLQLFIDGGSFVPNRFVFHGPQPDDPVAEGMRMKLEIVYTKL